MLTNALVVLRLGQNLIVLSVGKYKDAALDTTHELFNDHTAGGVAKHAAEHLFKLLLGFFEGGEDEYALSCTEAVGLEHIRCFECFQEGQALLKMLAVEGLVACGGDVVALHECLGKVLGTFQYSSCL